MQYVFLDDDGFKVRFIKKDSNLEPLVITRLQNGAGIANMQDAEFHVIYAVKALIALVDTKVIIKSIEFAD